MLAALTEPTAGINYDVIALVQVAGALLAVLLAALHFAGISEVEGFFVIFTPFVPSLAWVLLVRSKWKAKLAAESKSAKSD